jgi:hypothetical protein
MRFNFCFCSSTARAAIHFVLGDKVPLYGPNSNKALIPHDYYFAFQTFVQMVGDVIPRKIIFSLPKFRRAWVEQKYYAQNV